MRPSAALWSFLTEIWDLAVWSDVRAGRIGLQHDDPAPFKLTVRLGMGLLFLLAGALPFIDRLRATSPLLPLAMPVGQRVLPYIPLLAVPLFYGLLALGWGYLLAGTSGAPGRLRALVLGLFSLFMLGLLSPRESLSPGIWPWVLPIWGSLVLLIILVGLEPGWSGQWSEEAPSALWFAVVLILCAVMLLGSYLAIAQIAAGARSGSDQAVLAALRLSANMRQLGGFLFPFFLLAGSQVAVLAVDLGDSGARWLDDQLSPHLWRWVLGAFLGLRLIQIWVYPLLSGTPRPLSWGAVVVVGLSFLAWGMMRRAPLSQASEASLWSYVIPALLLIGPLPLFQSITSIAGLAEIFFPVSAKQAQRFGELLEQANAAFLSFVHVYTFAVGGGLLLAGAIGWRRARSHRPRWTLVFLCIGGWMLLWKMTRAQGPLGRWAFDLMDVTTTATTAMVGLFVFLLLRGRLDSTALRNLSVAALALWLLEAYHLLFDPLSPLQALLRTEALFLSVGLLLSMLEMGEYFGLNRGSARLPRWSRIFLFLGYAIVAALFAHWGSLIHQPDYGEGYAQTGFLLLGIPLVLAALLSLS